VIDATCQPWLHEYDITVDGPVTVVSERSGDLGAPGTGIVVDDRRVVRTLWLRLDDIACVPVASAAVGGEAVHWMAARHLGDVGPDPTVEVHRRRTITGLTVTETITLRARGSDKVTTSLTILADGDGAEIAEIKTGGAPSAALAAATEHQGWSDDRHRTSLEAVPPADEMVPVPDGGLLLRWLLTVEPSGATTVELTWSIRRERTTSFDADAGSAKADWDPDELASGTDDPRVAALVRVGLTDLRQLTLRDPLDGDLVAAAGTPWYLTLFGRDAIWASRFMVRHSRALTAGTLRCLARRQARDYDTSTAAEPGKILHEVRRTAAASAGLRLPPLYYGTVDATPLWVMLLHDSWQAGLPDDDVIELLPALDAALSWMEQAAANSPDGLLRYVNESARGLSNQGWKDSGDSMRRRDGSIAPPPIALLEVQAYAVEAAHGAAVLRVATGRDDGGWHGWADDLADRVRDRFWVDDGNETVLAMALDGYGRPVDGVASNMGHALGTGLLSAEEAARVVERLLRPDMLRTFGIGTLSSENPGYNPLGYHTGSVWTHDTAIIASGMARAGFVDEAAVVAERLVRLGEASGYRLPELCAGEAVGRCPVPYPAACRPQAWAAAAAAVVLDLIG
jgi:glycogen debranching enzyme